MENSDAYFDRAWADLKSDDGWWKAIIAFGLLNCVPIIGQIIVFGYLFDWAKEACWGMNVPLSRQVGDIGRRIKYGFLTLWVMVLWLAPLLLASWLLSLIPVAGGVLSFLMQVFAVFAYPFAAAGALRSMIYEHVMPGLQVKRIVRMARHDFGGLMQSFCVILLIVPLVLAALFVMMLPTIPFINLIATTTLSLALGTDLGLIVLLGMLTIVVAIVVWVACSIVSALIFAIFLRSLGLWMEQFKPAEWRSPAVPMAFELEDEAKKEQKAKDKKAAKEAEKHAKKEAKDAKKQAKKAAKTGKDAGAEQSGDQSSEEEQA